MTPRFALFGRAQARALLAAGWALLALSAPLAAQAQCGPLSSSSIASAGTTLTVGTGVRANGTLVASGTTGNILSTTGSRSTATVASSDSTPSVFPAYSGVATASGTSIPAGTYSTTSGATVKFSGGGGVYYISTIPNTATNLTFGAGTYYVNSWTLAASATVAATGNVRIYVGTSASWGASASVNSAGTSDQLLITLLGSATLTQAASPATAAVVKATLASSSATGSITLGSNTAFTGIAYSSGPISIGANSALATGATGSNTSSCPALLDYHMDEPSWSGVAGEVADSSGNGWGGTSKLANGSSAKATTASGSPAFTSGAQNTCGYGLFDRSSPTSATYTYVEVPAAFPPMNDSFTAMAWFRTTNPSASGQRVFVNDDADNGWAISMGDPGTGSLRIFNRNIAATGTVSGGGGAFNACGVFCIDSNPIISANAWYFVAMAVDTSANTVSIYIYNSAGTLVATEVGSFTGKWTAGAGLLAIGGETSSSAEGVQPSYHFVGNIDEPRIFRGAMSLASINAQKNRVRSCVIPVGSFAFSGTGAASTCSPQTISIAAKDSLGATLTSYTGTIALSSSTGHGTWALTSGSGTFTAGAADSGSATYSYSAADGGVATFTLSDSRAETLTASAFDASASVGSTSANVVFSDNAFVLAPTDSLGLEVVAGRPHAWRATFYRKDATTGLCSADPNYAGSKPLDFWYSATGSHPAGATAPAVSASPTCATSSSMPSSAPAANAASNLIALAFVSGAAPFYLCTSDVGQFALSARDDTLGYAGVAVSGSSSAATVRPFALWTDSVAAGAISNPGGTASSGSKFIPAQTAFSARVSAKLWASGQDSISPGVPDPGANLSGNGNAPRFAALSTLAASNTTPAAGVVGTLSGGSAPAASFALGSATLPALQYSEAGSAVLTARSAGYLGTSIAVPGVATGPVGRFYASSLRLASSAVSPACAAGGFTYMGQSFSASAQLLAVGAAGATLSNYDTAAGYAFVLSPAWSAVDSASGVDRGSRLSMGTAPAWSAGAWSYSSSSAAFARLATGPDGQYDSLLLGLSGSDPDGASIASLDMSRSAAGACSASCDAKAVGSAVKMRYGRLESAGAFGSVLPTLMAPLQALYWSRQSSGASIGWAPNTLDSCTAIPYASMSLGAYAGSLSAATLPSGSATLSGGKALVAVTRSGNAAVSGSVVLGINLGAAANSPTGCATGLPSVPASSLVYLQSNFCSSSSYARDPAAKIVWGAPAAKSNAIIFSRELY